MSTSNALTGKRVLVTRPAHQSAPFAQALRLASAEPILAPTIRIVEPDDNAAALNALQHAAEYAWIVFTSANGVHAFFAAQAWPGAARIAAIGSKTAQALWEHGVVADLVPQSHIAEALADALIETSRAGDRLLLYRAQEARDVLPDRLRAAGRDPHIVAAYKTVFTDDPQFAQKVAGCDVLTFASASSVRGFAHNLHGNAAAVEAARGKTVACIGPITAGEAREVGLDVGVTADTFTADGLVNALERALQNA